MIKEQRLVEWVEYCGNYYGTPKEYVLRELEKGRNIVLEIKGRINEDQGYVQGFHPVLHCRPAMRNWKDVSEAEKPRTRRPYKKKLRERLKSFSISKSMTILC